MKVMKVARGSGTSVEGAMREAREVTRGQALGTVSDIQPPYCRQLTLLITAY